MTEGLKNIRNRRNVSRHQPLPLPCLVALIIGVFVTMIITMFMTVAMYRQIKEDEEIVIVEE